MIVKNEAQIIERCLESVCDHIDAFVVCDTGSTDNTVHLIKSFFAQRNIQGTVYDDEWQDFATNRNLCLQRAKLTGCDFSLMIDADETLVVSDKRWKTLLDKDTVYSILTGTHNFVYAVPVLSPVQLAGKYVGVTHEYFDFPDGTPHKRLYGIRLLHWADGGSKQDKLERDKGLIERALRTEHDPGMVRRYLFYLAQTHYDMKLFDRAIHYYKQRIERGGWEEEVFYSYYRAALALLNMNNGVCTDKVVRWFLRAWQFRKTRLEPLYAIMRHCKDQNQAKVLGELGLPVKMTDDILFVEANVYNYDYQKLYNTLLY